MSTSAADRRSTEAARIRRKRRDEQDIGAIPPVADLGRRADAEGSFAFFCQTYFPASFTLPWSPYHHSAADRIERAVTKGGLFAFAMPRGSGKTTMCEWAILWAVLTGKVHYALLVGATQKDAESRLRGVRGELQSNDLLLDDWPEVCYPIHCLEREVRRTTGQKHHGEPTAMTWKNDKLVLPTVRLQAGEGPNVQDSPMVASTSGAVIDVTGITSSIRGLNHKREDGSVIRPQLAICDDPQTRESAKSVTQSADRAATIAGDVTYLAGPADKPIAVVLPCTVIYQDDMADQLLDRERHPLWQGERTKMVKQFPDGLIEGKLQSDCCRKWDEYKTLRDSEFRNGGDGSQATAFYRDHQAVMDDGFEVSWPERFSVGEVSAIQHAMNCYYRDPAAFFSEYQNEPVMAAESEPELTDDQIANKTNAYQRAAVPQQCETVTAFIDVGKDLLFWLVAAWEEGFSGQVLDYGVFPDQGAAHFSSVKPHRTMADASPGKGFEGTLYAGLDLVTRTLTGRRWQREDGVELPLSRLLIDANWGQSTPVVYRLCAASPQATLLPAHGKFVGAATQPWSEHKPKRGEKVGHHWRLGPSQTNAAVRRVLVDVNYWKSFVYDRLATAAGDRGCVSLFHQPGGHSLLAQHINAEYRVRVEAKASGRVVDEWKQRPDRPDNHWLDCLVGAAVAASIEGIQLSNVMPEGGTVRSRRRYTGKRKLSELRASKKRG